jgi:hypothetical protein
MKHPMQDTSPEVERVMLDLWRKIPPARRFTLVCDTSSALREFVLAGVRERYPGETPERLRRRLADVWLGEELARKAYGALPSDEPK